MKFKLPLSHSPENYLICVIATLHTEEEPNLLKFET